MPSDIPIIFGQRPRGNMARPERMDLRAARRKARKRVGRLNSESS
jgi:hypothetical protein